MNLEEFINKEKPLGRYDEHEVVLTIRDLRKILIKFKEELDKEQ